MRHRRHFDAACVVDPIEHPVRTPTRTELPEQRRLKWHTQAKRLLRYMGDELPHRRLHL